MIVHTDCYNRWAFVVNVSFQNCGRRLGVKLPMNAGRLYALPQ